MSKLIIGLGNPGEKYQDTRHNIGFRCLDILSDKLNATEFKNESKFEAQVAKLNQPTKTLLVKPQTYMNESGRSVAALKSYYKVENSDILVVYDELDLDIGVVRSRQGGSSAGHNGIKSIIQSIGEDFKRVRIGISGKHRSSTPSDKYVLKPFDKDESPLINKALEESSEIIKDYILEDKFEAKTNK